MVSCEKLWTVKFSDNACPRTVAASATKHNAGQSEKLLINSQIIDLFGLPKATDRAECRQMATSNSAFCREHLVKQTVRVSYACRHLATHSMDAVIGWADSGDGCLERLGKLSQAALGCACKPF